MKLPTFKKKKNKTPKMAQGAMPGSLTYIGTQPAIQFPYIQLFQYNETEIRETPRITENILQTIHEISPNQTNWLNIEGISNEKWIEQIGKEFGLHAMLLEDILNTQHRPKIEEFNDITLIIAKMLTYDLNESLVQSEQVSFVLKGETLLTFQELEGDVFEPVRTRIRKGIGRIRLKGSDYLLFSLLDAIIDHYVGIIEQIGMQLEELEDRILETPADNDIRFLHHYKRQFSVIRKSLHPLKDVSANILKGTGNILNEKNRFYYQDLHDNILTVNETMDRYYETLSDLQDFCFSNISNKMNNVIKTLTIISTIFIPLTFIVGVYGMNFRVMPELEWELGYWVVWGFMITLTLAMLIVFRKIKWI